MVNVLGYLTTNEPNQLVTTVILPFLLIFVIIWGALNMTRMFGTGDTARKINIIIALVITIFAAFTDAWGIIATQLAAFTGVFVYVMFFAVFILGTIFWAIGRTRGAYDLSHGTYKPDLNNLKELDKQIGKRQKKYEELLERGRDAEARALGETIIELKERRKLIILGVGSRR